MFDTSTEITIGSDILKFENLTESSLNLAEYYMYLNRDDTTLSISNRIYVNDDSIGKFYYNNPAGDRVIKHAICQGLSVNMKSCPVLADKMINYDPNLQDHSDPDQCLHKIDRIQNCESVKGLQNSGKVEKNFNTHCILDGSKFHHKFKNIEIVPNSDQLILVRDYYNRLSLLKFKDLIYENYGLDENKSKPVALYTSTDLPDHLRLKCPKSWKYDFETNKCYQIDTKFQFDNIQQASQHCKKLNARLSASTKILNQINYWSASNSKRPILYPKCADKFLLDETPFKHQESNHYILKGSTLFTKMISDNPNLYNGYYYKSEDHEYYIFPEHETQDSEKCNILNQKSCIYKLYKSNCPTFSSAANQYTLFHQKYDLEGYTCDIWNDVLPTGQKSSLLYFNSGQYDQDNYCRRQDDGRYYCRTTSPFKDFGECLNQYNDANHQNICLDVGLEPEEVLIQKKLNKLTYLGIVSEGSFCIKDQHKIDAIFSAPAYCEKEITMIDSTPSQFIEYEEIKTSSNLNTQDTAEVAFKDFYIDQGITEIDLEKIQDFETYDCSIDLESLNYNKYNNTIWPFLYNNLCYFYEFRDLKVDEINDSTCQSRDFEESEIAQVTLASSIGLKPFLYEKLGQPVIVNSGRQLLTKSEYLDYNVQTEKDLLVPAICLNNNFILSDNNCICPEEFEFATGSNIGNNVDYVPEEHLYKNLIFEVINHQAMVIKTDTVVTCLKICQNFETCNYFTFDDVSFDCKLYQNEVQNQLTASVDSTSSGNREDIFQYQIAQNFTDETSNPVRYVQVTNFENCQTLCNLILNCKSWYFDEEHSINNCFLYSQLKNKLILRVTSG